MLYTCIVNMYIFFLKHIYISASNIRQMKNIQIHPGRLTWKSENDSFGSDDFSGFQLGDFCGFHVEFFQGMYINLPFSIGWFLLLPMVLSWDVRQPPFPSHLSQARSARAAVAASSRWKVARIRRFGGGYQGVSNIGFLSWSPSLKLT